MAEFPRVLMKLVIAQICQSYDFTGIESSACDALMDMLQRYIEEIGYYATTYAQHAGRVDCNANDILNGLSELNVSYEDLRNHFSHSQEILLPFERSIPKFPLVQKTKKPKLEGVPNAKTPLSIFNHFAPYPDNYTYIQTPLVSERETQLKEIQKKKLKERNEAQSSLLKIQGLSDSNKITDMDVLNVQLLPDDDFIKFKEAFSKEFPDTDLTELEGGTESVKKYISSLFQV